MNTADQTTAHAAVERYQGWTNRETWALMLHVSNDQGLYHEFRDIVRPDGDAEQWALEGAVKDLAESYFTPDGYYEMTGDVIQNGSTWQAMQEIGSLWRVDWAEATAALLED